MYHVYILTNRMHGTLYIGVTGTLAARIYQHRNGQGSSFVRKHGLFRLVCALPFDTALEAIAHEKRIKKWPRHWKIRLIQKDNPEWRDLFANLNF